MSMRDYAKDIDGDPVYDERGKRLRIMDLDTYRVTRVNAAAYLNQPVAKVYPVSSVPGTCG